MKSRFLAVPLMLTGAAIMVCNWFAACSSFSTIGPAPSGSLTTTEKGMLPLHIGLVTADPSKETTAAPQTLKIGKVNGLLYYLPKGRIHITGDFGSAPTTSTGKQTLPQAAPQGSQSLTTGASPTDPSNDNSAQQKNFVITIAADFEADPEARYYLKPDRNYAYDDDIHLTINAKHLLSTGNATASDQTAQIIGTTAQLAVQAMGSPLLNAAFAPQLPPMTVGDLLHLIDDGVWNGKLTPETSLAVPDYAQLLTAVREPLDALGAEKQLHVVALLTELSRGKNVTVKDLRDLLKEFLPDASDKTIILSKAADFFNSLLKALTASSQQNAKTVQPRPFNIIFDPQEHTKTNDSVSADQLPIWKLNGPKNGDLSKCGFNVQIEELRQPNLQSSKSIWKGRPRRAAGIVFRSVKPYRVTVESQEGASFYIKQGQLVLLPDPDVELVLDYSRIPFVKKVTNMTFVDGVPQDFAQTVPSAAVGFLAIPKAILDAIIPIPSKTSPTKQGNAP